ncbi:glycosyl transferase [Rhizobium sp. R72]|uniref:glycosyltransferase family 2 protein n=1 Tax=unclassified Rhizobium TaxID=2613769 RepID=UPI000B52E533|nr:MULTISPECIES: glycosyltransferase family 2 protein [unclassified Rhizobium]OWV96123.1 glycosyl transferase [Rhizobium sp. R72]OWV96607.1 glycosyl transferase [Rhizobium sp. R711]
MIKEVSEAARNPTLPRLAVIIACFNYADYVEDAIRSVLDQNCKDCELIVVDDGSTDGSWDVIKRHPVSAYRIDNCGQRAACFFGMTKTQAPFVLFLDADDALCPGSLATILAKLDDRVAKLQFPLLRTDRNGLIIGEPVPKLGAFRDTGALAQSVLRNGTYVSPPTSGNVFRRDLSAILKGATYDRAVDGILLFAAPFFGDVVSLSTPLGRYRVHDRNDSGLGRPLDAQILRREIARFVNRMDHLRHVLEPLGKARELVAADETQFFLERSFYLAVAEGRRVRPTTLWRLVKKIGASDNLLKTKLVMTIFLFLTAVLPNRQARRGLSYRLDAGKRSMSGLLRALF